MVASGFVTEVATVEQLLISVWSFHAFLLQIYIALSMLRSASIASTKVHVID